MSKEKRIKRELYDPKIHGDFSQYSANKPEKEGYYRVVYMLRNITMFVSDYYYWGGASWLTPYHKVASGMVWHIPESWRKKK